MDQLVMLHRDAVEDLDRIATSVRTADLNRPTPCTAWSVADLLAHSIGQHSGFAAAVREGDADPAAYRPVAWTRIVWEESVADLLDAFAGADITDSAHQVELQPGQPLPIRVIVAAQLLDSAVHAWDLASALDREYIPEPQVLAAVLRVARQIPDGDNRDLGGSFAHALAPVDDAHDWAHALRLLGRDPDWSARPD